MNNVSYYTKQTLSSAGRHVLTLIKHYFNKYVIAVNEHNHGRTNNLKTYEDRCF